MNPGKPELEAMNLHKGTIGLIFLLAFSSSCKKPDKVHVSSPDGAYRFELRIEDSLLYYSAYYKDTQIIGQSALGFALSGSGRLPRHAAIDRVKRSQKEGSWTPVYGERSLYPDNYHQVLVSFSAQEQGTPAICLTIRAYNEGLAFRYEFESADLCTLESELTEFALPLDSDLWVSRRAQSEIFKVNLRDLGEAAVERPLLAQLSDSLFVSIGEAALVDFARMKFKPAQGATSGLRAFLDGEVVFEGTFQSPWRTIMAGNTAGEILENNYLLLNLNEPNQMADSDWIKPGKVIREVTLTTEGGLACVDFAKKHNLQFVEFDAGWYGPEYEESSDATTITVDPARSKGPLDLHQVIEYAESQGIGILLYVNRRALEKQLDELLPLVKSWGVKGLKYGFVNVGSQEWTSWLHEAVRKAADHKLMVDIHDEYRPTGYSRTYPNLMTQEGIRGDEESPTNSMVLKTLFTRMLAGAGDHTNCYFDSRVDERMGSHASQLAKAVCIYSPWQFLFWYDRPEGSPRKTGGAGGNENYILEVAELDFFDLLPTVWDDTRVLEGYPGKYALLARRSESTWFVGALNGDQDRDFSVSLDFLDPDTAYRATIYTDDGDMETETRVSIESVSVNSGDILVRRLAPQQGMAMVIRAL